MKRFKVEQVVLCEVRVWGWITADHMPDAMIKAVEMGTDRSEYDHEIISDIKTLSMEIKEEV
jgi:hypothetical protein